MICAVLDVDQTWSTGWLMWYSILRRKLKDAKPIGNSAKGGHGGASTLDGPWACPQPLR